MPDLTRRRLPPHVPHLACRSLSAVVPVGFGRVVVVPRLGRPRADRLRVEGPVRDVDAADPIDQRATLERARREPLARVPAANLLAHLRFGNLERQETLRPDWRLDLLVVDQCRRAAEVAVLPDALGIEDGDRLAALALHRAPLGEPPAGFVGQLAKGLGQIVLDQRAGGGINGKRRRRSAERADEELFRWIPHRLRATRRARMLVESRDVGHRWIRCGLISPGIRRARFA